MDAVKKALKEDFPGGEVKKVAVTWVEQHTAIVPLELAPKEDQLMVVASQLLWLRNKVRPAYKAEETFDTVTGIVEVRELD